MSSVNKQLSWRSTELFSTGDEALADEILSPDVMFQEQYLPRAMTCRPLGPSGFVTS